MSVRNLFDSRDNLRSDSRPGPLPGRTFTDMLEHISHDYFQNVQQLPNGFILSWCQDAPRTLLFIPRQKPCTLLTQYADTKYAEWELLLSTQVSEKWRLEEGNLYPVIRGIETIVLFD